MNKKSGFKEVLSSLVIATGLLAISAPTYSESMSERSGERQEARDTKQGGREAARDAKAALVRKETRRIVLNAGS